jgi:bacterial/archaeal transporter family protein
MEKSIEAWWIYALLSALFGAMTTIFAKIGVQNIDSNLATAIRSIVILIISWGVVFTQGNIPNLWEIPDKTIAFLVLSGVATGLSWLFYYRALQVGNTAFVASIDKSSVAIVLLFSVVFLQEPLTWKLAIGICAIAFGVLVIIL